MINIGVPGVSGRMGTAIVQQVLQDPQLNLSSAVVRPGNAMVGSKIQNSNVIISDTLNYTIIDVLVDFTLPTGVMEHLEYCLQHDVAMVIGATGFTLEQLEVIKQASQKIAIVQSYNMSVGVNVSYKLIKLAAQLLDDSWSAQIYDVHHQHKKDIPSGTAKEIAKIITTEREVNDVPIHSERIGEVVGDHSVIFSNPSENITINHQAITRDIFAKGAIIAAKWIYGKAPGLYTMQDVI